MVTPYLQENLISTRRTNDYSLILQRLVADKMKCRQYQTTMRFQDIQSHIGDCSVTNNRYIGTLSTEWTHMNQPCLQPHLLGLGK